ncbi:sugar kinase NBD/HSP70 family [Candidatus Termititenax persephonae]|uniref:Sugar kinase NBD/HSP70 family n=1 Tax=Candidatus Termititenax persephonae TaxID=2218525 RepID=A0A388TG73_9BACT|nr:sugar kinase NBD/HSP70 family [Candidatus Termititenax persephonae]
MYIGVDLGGTKITAGLADKAGQILQKETVRTGQNVTEQLAELIQRLSAGQHITKIGLGVPGQVKDGQVFSMPNIPQLGGVNLWSALNKLYPADYTIENDANAAAMAELRYGAGRGCRNFIYVTISTGIGGGIIIDGKLYAGANGTAGEFGHVILLPDGPLCGCGNKGCWESLGSGTALAKMVAAKVESGEATRLKELAKADQLTAETVVEAAKQGDPTALELLDVNGYYNAIGLANLVNTFDPEMIIIGGGLSFNGDYFFQPLLKNLRMFRLFNPEHSIKILRAGCGRDAGLLGAVALVLP